MAFHSACEYLRGSVPVEINLISIIRNIKKRYIFQSGSTFSHVNPNQNLNILVPFMLAFLVET